MSSAFLAIQTALVGVLTATPALAGGRIYTNRLRAVDAASTSALVVRLDAAEGTEFVLGTVDWVTPYAVECYARAASGTDPALAADALLCAVWERLTALNFEALGADISLTPRIDWQFDDADTPLVCAVVRLTARHRTTAPTLQP